VTVTRASVRRHVRIARKPDDIWALIGDPARIQEWWPGIDSSTVDGTTRVIITGAGLPMPEEILTCDRLQRRFQYRITAPLFKEHLSTLDVFDLEDGTSLVSYSADASPAIMALVIAGAAGNALNHLKELMEGTD
jgi:uncharacterized protein YndB with AHSA1/START domain